MKQIVKHCKKIKTTKTKIKPDYIVALFFFVIIICIVINPFKYSQVAYKGLEVWAKILVPSLLPFFIVSKLFTKGNFLNDFTSIFSKPMKKLYKCPPQSAYVFFMSILSGYPVGAKLVSDLYKNGRLKKSDAVKTLSFSANSGPMFILGSVAIGMFSSRELGLLIYFSHVLGSILNGFIYRNYTLKNEDCNLPNETLNDNNDSFTDSINSSISSILLIGGVICFTFVLIESITSSFIYKGIMDLLKNTGLNSNIFSALFSGIFEITKGCILLANIPLAFNIIAILCTFIISFGGISTLLQAVAFTKDIIPTKLFILQKITHTLCATFVCFILLTIF